MSDSLPEDATCAGKPGWLMLWEDMLSDIESEGEQAEKDLLQIFRRLLEAPENDTHAVDQAAKDIRDYYTTHYNDDTPGLAQMPGGGAGYMIEVISSHAFDLAVALFPGNVNHDRLGGLLVELKAHAAEKFNPEAAELGYDATGLLITVNDHWNHDYGHLRDNETSVRRCDEWIATSSLIARLLGENMLRREEISLATEDIKECLNSPAETKLSELGRNCRILVAANWILQAGSQLFEETRPDPKERARRLAPGTWAKLASRFQEVASGSKEPNEEQCPAHWKLKEASTKALQRMQVLDGAQEA